MATQSRSFFLITSLICMSLCPLLQGQQVTQVFVIPNQPWTDTGIQVNDGQPLNISATGGMDYWTGGCPANQNCVVSPDGLPPCPNAEPPVIFPDLNCVSLLGMIGQNNQPFEVGSAYQSIALSSGELYLGVNDGNFSDNTLGWTATISSTCLASQSDVFTYMGGTPSDDNQPTTMGASFEPGMSVSTVASACGYIGFDWQQTIDILPPPSPLVSCNFGSSPLNCFSAISNPLVALSAPPTFLDPVPGGYTYQLPNGDDSYPFYFEPVSYISNQQDHSTILFSDTPAYHALPAGQYMEFTTNLVGVTEGYNPSSTPIATFSWVSDFNGTSGGVATTKNLNPADPHSGTGGSTIMSVGNVPQNSVIALPAGVNFANVPLNEKRHKRLMVLNNGTGPLLISAISLINVSGNPGDFNYIEGYACDKKLLPGRSCEIRVFFETGSQGTETATLQIDTNAPDAPVVQVGITATGYTRIRK